MVFLSYAHEDKKWARDLGRMLAPEIRDGSVDLWADTRIGTGESWRAEIDAALDRANVIVMLVSDHFLASRFITDVELPAALARRARGQAQICWCLVSEAMYERTALAEYQAAHDISRPLDSLKRAARKRVLKQIAEKIRELCRMDGGALSVSETSVKPLENHPDLWHLRIDAKEVRASLNWKDLLVEIFVPTGPGDSGLIGTGYPVADKRILTAGHLVTPEEGTTGPICVRWYHRQGEAREWREIDKVVWNGWTEAARARGEAWDLAVLECDFPDDIDTNSLPPLLRHTPPPDAGKWASEAFPEAGERDDGSHKPVAMHGETDSCASTARIFELTVEAAPRAAEDWRGASGAPVMLLKTENGESKPAGILGLVASCQEIFKGRRLNAVPMWRLRAHSEFLAATNAGRDDDALAAAVAALTQTLAKSERLMDELEKELKIDARRAGTEARAYNLAQHLFGMRFEDFMKTLNKSAMIVCSGRHGDDCRTLLEAAEVVMPYLVDNNQVQTLKTNLGNRAAVAISVPSTTGTMAEIYMAAVDGKKAALALAGGREPAGTMLIDFQPAEGVDDKFKIFEAEFHKEMITRFVPEDPEYRAYSQGDLIPIAADRLKDSLNWEGRHYYFLTIKPNEPLRQEQWEAVLGRLKQHYSVLVFIDLAVNPELLRQEAAWGRLLGRLLDKAGERT